MKKNSLSSRLLSVLLAFAMCLTLMPEALAESTTASTMQLIKTEGTVSIENNNGRNVTAREKMRLYNGYSVSTEKTSYAWINLDDAKQIKEDAVSKVSIRKSGKKLELLLDEGNIFFNVTEPLNSDESLNIRTSTMVVGIRGTCGWVKVLDEWNSQVYVLEGSIEVTVTDPVTGENKTETVAAGETAQCVVYPQDHTGAKCDILRQRYSEENVEGFVLMELLPDEGLCGEIYDDSGLDLRDLTESGVEDRLRQDQAAVQEELDEIARQIEQQDNNVSVGGVWANPDPGTAPAAPVTPPGSNNISYNPTPTPAPAPAPTPDDPAPAPTVVTLMMPLTDDEVQDAVNAADTVNVQAADNGTANLNFLRMDSGLTVPEGKALNLEEGIDTGIDQGAPLQVHGTMNHGGSIDSAGYITVTSSNTLRVGGNLTSSGTMSVTATGRVVVDGTFTNSGVLAPVQGAVIQARSFNLANPVTDWAVSEDPDSDGYLRLVYVGSENPDPQTFTVTFDPTGGTVSPLTATTNPDGTLSSLPTPEKDGYTFDGWYTAASGGTKVTTSYKFTADATIYAQWTAVSSTGVQWEYDESTNTLRIYGSGPMESVEGYTPGGDWPWASYSGTVTNIVIEDGVTTIGEGAFSDFGALTGVDIPDSVESIGDSAFDGCGELDTVDYGGTMEQWEELKANVGTGNDPLLNAEIHCSDGIVGVYTITFDPNGGTVSPLTAKTNPDGTLSSLPTAEKDGYSFDGWFTAVSGGTKVTTSYKFTADTTIYAQWTAVSSTGVQWEYIESTNTLRIYGSGPMESIEEYVKYHSYPWNKTEITTFVVEDGVTSIGDNVFYQCKNLTQVTIGADVESIGSSAFQGCTGLTAITLPDKLTSIGDYAFYECTNLTLAGAALPDKVVSIGKYAFCGCSNLTTTLNIPNTTTSIGADAFNECASLTSVTIGNHVESIGDRAFRKTGLEHVTFASDSQLSSIGGYAFSECGSLTSITIPDNVTSIGGGAFQNTGLTSVIIPNKVESIDGYAFNGCSGLTSVTIGTSVKTIGNYAFYGCENLAEATYPGTKAQWDANVTVGTGNEPLLNALRFEGDSSEDKVDWEISEDGATLRIYGSGPMESVEGYTAPSPGTDLPTWPWASYSGTVTNVVIEKGVTTVGPLAFDHFSTLASVDIPDSVDTISGTAFSYCTRLTSITIPKSVTRFVSSAFQYCTSLTSITVDSANPAYASVNGVMFTRDMKELILYPISHAGTAYTVPDGVESIGNLAFQDCASLTGITLPHSVTSIGRYTFSGCSSLTSINIPDSVTSIGIAAFAYCTRLTSINIPDGVPGIDERTFSYCRSLTSIDIPDSVASIGRSAFEYCDRLASITIPKSVTSIEAFAFSGCTGLESAAIEDGVKTIGASAFVSCSKLTEITIPKSVTSIGDGAFSGCTNLKTVHYGGTRAEWQALLPNIGDSNDPLLNAEIIFDGDASDGVDWEYIESTNTLRIYGSGPMESVKGYTAPSTWPWASNKGSIATVVIEEGVTTIGGSAFWYFTQMSNVTIPDGVTSIGDNAFNGCSGLIGVSIPASVESIGASAFAYCSGLTEVTYAAGSKVTAISNSTFEGCTKLGGINIPDGVTRIGSSSFNGCIGLTSIAIPASVESIGAAAFYNCGLTAVTFAAGNKLSSIGSDAFHSCTSLTGITIPGSVETIGAAAFYGCSKLESAILENGVKTIGDTAFDKCSALAELTIPDSVTSIGGTAFGNCRSLTSVTIPGGVETISGYAFSGCTGLKNVVIEDGVKTIGTYAFSSCGFTEIYIPKSITSIANAAFYSCGNLKTVHYGGTRAEWEALDPYIGETNDPLRKAEVICTDDGDTPGVYTITFEGNGGSCTTISLKTDGNGRLANQPADPVHPDGSAFDSWFTSDIGGERVTASTVFTENTTVYARWCSKSGGANALASDGTRWAYYEDTKTLYIFGNGSTSTCLNAAVAPWNSSDFGAIETLLIEEGVTDVADSLFDSRDDLTNVTLPSTLTSIARKGFSGCTALKTITLPKNLTYIGNLAFDSSALTSIEIPASVTTIGQNAFSNCGSLESAKVHCTIPGSATAVFMRCGNLTTAEIGEGNTYIPEQTFYGCSSLTSVTLPSTLGSVGRQGFQECGALKTVHYGGKMEDWNNNVKPNIYATGNAPLLNVHEVICSDGTISNPPYTITFDPNGGTSNSFPSQTDADGTITYGLPTPTHASLAFDSWFTEPTGGKRVTRSTVFDGDTTVYAHWCTRSGGGASTFGTGNGWSYYADTHTLYIFGAGSTSSISNPLWDGAQTDIQTAQIEDGITDVFAYLFRDYSGLTGVTIPAGVASIGYAAFSGCTGLNHVSYGGTVEEWNALVSNGKIDGGNEPLLKNTIHCSNGDVAPAAGGYTITFDPNGGTLDAGKETAETDADGKLAALPTPARTVRQIESASKSVDFTGWFKEDGTEVTTDTVFSGDCTVTAHWAVDWDYDGAGTLTIIGNGTMDNYSSAANESGVYVTTAPWKELYTEIKTVVIGDDVTNIGDNAFYRCSSVISVTIPESVTTIGESALSRCTSLASLNIPEGVTNIEYGAFSWNSGLISVTLPESLTSIGTSAFANCSNLKNLAIPSNVEKIGGYAFQACSSWTAVTIPSSVNAMGTDAFRESGLESVRILEGLTKIPSNTFTQCTSLKTVTIPQSVTAIDAYAFSQCSQLADVYYAGSQAQWNLITINSTGNDALTSATKHWNSTAPEAGASVTLSVLSNAAPAGYTDVPADAWYADAANYCRDNGLMQGTSAATFSPDGTLTRAMMVTVLHRLAGKPAAAKTASFADVEAGKWYTEAVSWANSEKIVLGYNETTFGPDDPVTHEQVSLIMQRYSGDSNVKTYGMDAPKAPATRAEIAATLMEYAEGNHAPGTLSTFSAMNIMCAPSGIARDGDGTLLVTDLYHKQIWRVRNRASTSYAGGATVEDLYGQPVGGYNDAGLDGSYFKEPWAIAPFLGGWAVSDTDNNVVRLIQGGSVRTLNGATNEKLTVTDLGVAFDHPTGLAADDEGNLYVSDTFNGAVRKVTPEGGVSTVAKGLSEPTGLCWKDGVLYVAETGKNRIVKVEDGKVTGISGQYAFSGPQGVTVGGDGSVYVSDTGNGAVCRIKDGKVAALIQSDSGLTSPAGLLELDGKLYICDTFARKVFVYQIG